MGDVVGLSDLVNQENTKNVDLKQLEIDIINEFKLSTSEKSTSENIDNILKDLDSSLGLDVGLSDNDSDDEDDSDDDIDSIIESIKSNKEVNYTNYNETKYEFKDADLRRMTQEELKQNKISAVMDQIGNDQNLFDIEKEKLEEDKSLILEQIDELRTQLEEDDIDISRIPTVSQDSPVEQIRNIQRILMRKCDRTRYHAMAEEFAIGGIQMLELIFDGKRTFFKKYKPDLTGYHNTARVKLRRMRIQTSTIVGDIMNDYNIGPGMRIALELIPSLITHTRMRDEIRKRQQYDKQDVTDAISAVRDLDDD